MFGIPGLDPFGLVHAAFGMASVVLGLGVGLLPKGSAAHRRLGLLYAVSMLLLNVTALAIYDLFGGFGPFHGLALVSLATLAAGIIPLWLRRPGWVHYHAHFMTWSYAGVVAAFIAEIASRIPGVGLLWGTLLPMALVMTITGLLVRRRVPAAIARLG